MYTVRYKYCRTVSDEASKVPTDDAVPCRTLTAVELHLCQRVFRSSRSMWFYFFLDVLSDILCHGLTQESGDSKVRELVSLTFSMLNCSIACCATSRQCFAWLDREITWTHQLRWPLVASHRSVEQTVSSCFIWTEQGILPCPQTWSGLFFQGSC